MKHLLVLIVFVCASLGCQTYESQPGNVCKPNCKDRECGDDGCGGSCGECGTYEQCEEGTCVTPPCCQGFPDGTFHILVSGQVIDATTLQPVQAAVAPISPLDALTNPRPIPLDYVESYLNGRFHTDCFNVTDVALGIVFLADDIGFDGTPGTYFPTGTVVASWDTNSEKRCVYDAKVFVVPTTLVAGLDQLPDMDSNRWGFVMGFVLDQNDNLVEGAEVKPRDGSIPLKVYYPNSDFTELLTRTTTSVNGIFILPGTSFETELMEITAEKSGMEFSRYHVASKAGFCYFVIIQAS